MTEAEKAKEEKISKKTKKKALPAMKAEYGDKKGEQVYYAWKRKQAMREESDCGCEEEQRDKRGDYAKKELIKNQIRARLGIKNPLVMVASEEVIGEEDKALEMVRASVGAGLMTGKPKRKKLTPEQQAEIGRAHV